MHSFPKMYLQFFIKQTEVSLRSEPLCNVGILYYGQIIMWNAQVPKVYLLYRQRNCSSQFFESSQFSLISSFFLEQMIPLLSSGSWTSNVLSFRRLYPQKYLHFMELASTRGKLIFEIFIVDENEFYLKDFLRCLVLGQLKTARFQLSCLSFHLSCLTAESFVKMAYFTSFKAIGISFSFIQVST